MAGNENNFPKKPGKPNAPLNPWEIAQPIDEEPEPMILADSGDDSIDFGAVSNVHEGASGIIPLADLPDPTSSASIISWAEVIRQQKESILDDNQDSGLKVDSVSDKDLRRHMPGINSFVIPEPSSTQSLPHAAGPVPVPEAFGADDMGSAFFGDPADDIRTLPTDIYSDPQAEVRTTPTAVPRPPEAPPAGGIFDLDPDEGTHSGSAVSFHVVQTPKMPKAIPQAYPVELVEAEVIEPPTADDIFLPNAEDITDSDFYPEARMVDGSTAGRPVQHRSARAAVRFRG